MQSLGCWWINLPVYTLHKLSIQICSSWMKTSNPSIAIHTGAHISTSWSIIKISANTNEPYPISGAGFPEHPDGFWVALWSRPPAGHNCTDNDLTVLSEQVDHYMWRDNWIVLRDSNCLVNSLLPTESQTKHKQLMSKQWIISELSVIRLIWETTFIFRHKPN